MTQYFLTPEAEVIEANFNYRYSEHVNGQSDYDVNWRKGKGKWKSDSANSFNERVKRESWASFKKELLIDLGLL
jgi:hypothetical protein